MQITEEETDLPPPAPLSTSQLWTELSGEGVPVQEVADAAQELHMRRFINYPRTLCGKHTLDMDLEVSVKNKIEGCVCIKGAKTLCVYD